jgi:small neutral amino acid transporter SnatA (MarC family)
MEKYAQSIVTLPCLINPVICGVLFASVTAGQSRPEQIRDATRVALILLTILFLLTVDPEPPF